MIHRLSKLAALVLAVLLGVPLTARAQFATTNVQALQGWDFEDPSNGNATEDGTMTTLTVNHYSVWKYGDNFAFVDLARGKFVPGGLESAVYSEWHPRLFLNRLAGQEKPALGIFRDYGLAFEVNQGAGFYAYMAGLGFDVGLPNHGVFSLNVYYRYDSSQFSQPHARNHTWQASPSWGLPFSVGPVPVVFAGFVDVNGANDNEDVEVLAQPQLLVDLLGALGGPKGKLLAGVEWYLHYNEANELLGADELVSAPQALVQWTLH